MEEVVGKCKEGGKMEKEKNEFKTKKFEKTEMYNNKKIDEAMDLVMKKIEQHKDVFIRLRDK